MYEILKVLNHNTILVLKENEEIIVMSKGIGFGKKQGENSTPDNWQTMVDDLRAHRDDADAFVDLLIQFTYI